MPILPTLFRVSVITTLAFAAASTVLAQGPTVAKPNSLSTPKKKPGKGPRIARSVHKTSREVPDVYKGRVLTVGSGGGVVGTETAYYLLDDGRLFSKTSKAAIYTFMGNQTAENTKRVFWSVEDRCNIKKTAFDKPGNIYRFIQWHKGAEKHKVTWMPGDKALPANYEKVYTGFMGMLPKSKS